MNESFTPPEKKDATRKAVNKPMPLKERLVSLFFSPKELMADINAHPVFAPLIIVFAVIGIAMAGPSARLSIITLEEMKNLGLDYTSVLDELLGVSGVEALEDAAAVSVSSYIGGMFSGIVSSFVTCFFSTVGLVIIMFFFRLKIKFSQLYSMFLHISVITGLLGVIAAIISVACGSSANMLSLGGMLMPAGDITNPAFAALCAVSAANVWQALLVMTGLEAIAEADKTKAIAVPAVYLAITCVFSAVGALITRYTSELMRDFINGVL